LPGDDRLAGLKHALSEVCGRQHVPGISALQRFRGFQRDGANFSKRDPVAQFLSRGHLYAYSNSYRESDSVTYFNTYSNSHSDADFDRDALANADPNAFAYSDPDSDSKHNSYSDEDADSYSHGNSNLDVHC